ncbi:MAG: hypothetical protein WC314_01765 [Vulcanimicrobiota bacterium]
MSQGKVYKTRITPKAVMYGAIPIASALVLGHFSLDAATKFHPNDPTRIFFAGIPALIAAALLLSLFVVCNHFLGRTIELRGKEMFYKDSKHVICLNIIEMAFSPPSDKAALKSIMFSDGAIFVQLPEIFMSPESFRELLDTIQRLRREQDFSGQKTWTL